MVSQQASFYTHPIIDSLFEALDTISFMHFIVAGTTITITTAIIVASSFSIFMNFIEKLILLLHYASVRSVQLRSIG